MKELKNRDIPYKIYLSEDEMPRYWYNVRADMKNKPAPLLNPGTLKPMTAEEMGFRVPGFSRGAGLFFISARTLYQYRGISSSER